LVVHAILFIIIIIITSQKAADKFCQETDFDVEECCIDHFYWFDKSTRRKGQLSDYASFCDTEYHSFVKHINVRWLSLEKAVGRILKMFTGTRSYFLSENLKDARFQRLKQMYENPLNYIHLLFFQASLPAFTTFNLFLQRDAPQIYLLHGQMLTLLRKMLSRFISADVIKENADDLTKIEYQLPENQLSNSSMFIGLVAKSEISKNLEAGDISEQDVKKFYRGH
jgi:hypothetical protein